MQRGREQDKAVAQKTALCRISSLPAGALAFQRSEDRSDTAERCSRLVCHNQGRLLVLHYYQTHLSRFRTTHPFLTALLSALKLLHFIFGQTVLTQKAGNWWRRSQLSSWRAQTPAITTVVWKFLVRAKSGTPSRPMSQLYHSLSSVFSSTSSVFFIGIILVREKASRIEYSMGGGCLGSMHHSQSSSSSSRDAGQQRVCIPKQEAFAAGNRLPHRCSDTATKIGPS